MKNILTIISLLILLVSCLEKNPAPVIDPQVLMEADIAFSDLSIKTGYQKAFIEFAHDSVVLGRKMQRVIGSSLPTPAMKAWGNKVQSSRFKVPSCFAIGTQL